MDHKKENCVTFNVFVKCGKDRKCDCNYDYPEHDEKKKCVEVNVFVECDKD